MSPWSQLGPGPVSRSRSGEQVQVRGAGPGQRSNLSPPGCCSSTWDRQDTSTLDTQLAGSHSTGLVPPAGTETTVQSPSQSSAPCSSHKLRPLPLPLTHLYSSSLVLLVCVPALIAPVCPPSIQSTVSHVCVCVCDLPGSQEPFWRCLWPHGEQLVPPLQVAAGPPVPLTLPQSFAGHLSADAGDICRVAMAPERGACGLARAEGEWLQQMPHTCCILGNDASQAELQEETSI